MYISEPLSNDWIDDLNGGFSRLKNGKSIDIYSCSDEDAKDYANRWKTALEDSQGQISEIPLLIGDKND